MESYCQLFVEIFKWFKGSNCTRVEMFQGIKWFMGFKLFKFQMVQMLEVYKWFKGSISSKVQNL